MISSTTRALAFLGLLAFPSDAAEEEEVSRTPPPLYEERLAPLLTPTEEALALPVADKAEDGSYEIILFEELTAVEDSGTGCSVRHTIVRILEEEGVEHASWILPGFSEKRQKLHLVRAQTIRPDSSRVEPDASSVFLQKRSTEDRIYDDRYDLVVLFSDATPGAVIELATVRETFQPVLPDAFVNKDLHGFPAPTRRFRYVHELHPELAPQLRTHGVAGAKAEPDARTKTDDGWTRIAWQRDNPLPIEFESDMPTASVPIVFHTTLQDWSAVGAWFADHFRDDALGEGAADAWTGDAESPRAMAQALYDRVSRDIRYTGLELGRGAYNPRPPATVLETGFGDCKDKANLLRVLLLQKGISSRIALVNTRHAGAIERAVPSHNLFNHAILAIDLPDRDTPLVCDPTQAGVPLGVLGPRSSGRPALLVASDGTAEWYDIPVEENVGTEVDGILDVEPGGGYSGWLTIQYRGHLAGLLRHRMATSTWESNLSLFVRLIGGLGGAKIADYESEGFDAEQCMLALRLYVVKTGAAVGANDKRARIDFATCGSFGAAIGREAKRHTPAFLALNETTTRFALKLPENYTILDIPDRFEREVPSFSTIADWEAKGESEIVCHLESKVLETLVPPAEYRELHQLNRDLAAWLETPTLVKVTPPPAGKPAEKNMFEEADEDEKSVWTPAPEELPRMPTADGQTRLIEIRFPFDLQNPFDADHAARSVAYSKMAEFFPEDDTARFRAGVASSVSRILDFDGGGTDDSVEKLLDEFRDKLPRSETASGEVAMVLALVANDRNEEALELASRVWEDEEVPQLQRLGMAVQLSELLFYPDPARSLELAREGSRLKPLPDLAADQLAVMRVHCIARLPDATPEKILEEWRAVENERLSTPESIRESILGIPIDLVDSGEHVAADLVVEAIRKVSSGWDQEDLDAFEAEANEVATAKEFAPLHSRLRNWLIENPWPIETGTDPEDETDPILGAAEAASEADWYSYSEPGKEIDLLLQALVHYGPQPEYPDLLESLAESLENWLEDGVLDKPEYDTPPPESAEALLDLAYTLWRESDEESFYPEMAKITTIERREGYEAALGRLEEFVADPQLAQVNRATAIRRMAAIHGAKGNIEAQAETLLRLESLDEIEAGSDLLRAPYLQLTIGKFEDAWKTFERIDAIAWEGNIAKAVRDDLVALNADPEAKTRRERLWLASGESKWWQRWSKLCKRLNIDENGDVPFDEPEDFLEEAKSALEEYSAYYLGRMANNALFASRWHPAFGKTAVEILRGPMTEAYPKRKKALEKVALELERALEQNAPSATAPR